MQPNPLFLIKRDFTDKGFRLTSAGESCWVVAPLDWGRLVSTGKLKLQWRVEVGLLAS